MKILNQQQAFELIDSDNFEKEYRDYLFQKADEHEMWILYSKEDEMLVIEDFFDELKAFETVEDMMRYRERLSPYIKRNFDEEKVVKKYIDQQELQWEAEMRP